MLNVNNDIYKQKYLKYKLKYYNKLNKNEYEIIGGTDGTTPIIYNLELSAETTDTINELAFEDLITKSKPKESRVLFKNKMLNYAAKLLTNSEFDNDRIYIKYIDKKPYTFCINLSVISKSDLQDIIYIVSFLTEGYEGYKKQFSPELTYKSFKDYVDKIVKIQNIYKFTSSKEENETEVNLRINAIKEYFEPQYTSPLSTLKEPNPKNMHFYLLYNELKILVELERTSETSQLNHEQIIKEYICYKVFIYVRPNDENYFELKIIDSKLSYNDLLTYLVEDFGKRFEKIKEFESIPLVLTLDSNEEQNAKNFNDRIKKLTELYKDLNYNYKRGSFYTYIKITDFNSKLDTKKYDNVLFQVELFGVVYAQKIRYCYSINMWDIKSEESLKPDMQMYYQGKPLSVLNKEDQFYYKRDIGAQKRYQDLLNYDNFKNDYIPFILDDIEEAIKSGRYNE